MAEYSAVEVQTVRPGETVLFTTAPNPCTRGFIKHRDGTGNFILSGWSPRRNTCGCSCCNQNRKSAIYNVDFRANLAIPTGGTAGPISVAIAVDGSTLPESIMTVTPTALNAYFNVSGTTNVDIFKGCCESVTIKNISTQSILVSNANIIFSRPDLAVTY